MKCPIDSATLVMTDRTASNHYSPECRGVWLDRGGLQDHRSRRGRVCRQHPSAPASDRGSGSRDRHAPMVVTAGRRKRAGCASSLTELAPLGAGA